MAALRAVSHDPTLTHLLTLDDGRGLTAVQLQMEYLDLARKFVEDRYGADADEQTATCWPAGSRCSTGSSATRCCAPRELDWVAKLKLLDAVPRPRRPGLGRRQAAPDRPAVRRRPPGEGPLPPAGRPGRIERLLDDAAVEAGHARPAGGHPGLLPGPLPGQVRRPGRRGVLGLGDLRPARARRRCSGCRPSSRCAAAGPTSGALLDALRHRARPLRRRASPGARRG